MKRGPVPSRREEADPTRTFALTLSALVLLAGCISGDEPVESADIQAAPPSADAKTPVSTSANATAQSAATPEGAAFPFSFEGKTGTWACVPDGPTSCRGLPAGTDSSNTFVELEYEGVPTAVDATLTWSATTPATAQMYAAVFAVRSCGEMCWESDGEMFSTYASGSSPLALSVADVTLGENETLILHVGTVDPTPQPPVMLFYSLEQAFSIEGAVRALVPPRA